MRSMLWNVLLWGSRCFTGILILVTLLPFLPSGSWMVRVWDFPRLQLAALCLTGLLVLTACTHRFGWTPGVYGFMIALGLAGAWQVSHVAPFTSLWAKHLADAKRTDFTLLISNLAFDNAKAEEAAATLDQLEVDAMLLIEIDSRWARTLAPLRAKFSYHVEEIKPDGLGMALWSNVPIERSEVRYIVSNDRPSIHADLVFSPTHRVRFVGLHPVPPGLPTDDGDERYDSRIRDAELTKVARVVADDPQATWIVAGDFNDVAWSHTTRLFQRISGLDDPRIGRGLFNTYDADRPLLRYPLDHVFVSPSFNIADITRIRVPGSDHFGIQIQLGFAQDETARPDADSEDHEEAEEIIEEGTEDAADEGELAPGAERDRGSERPD